LRLYSLAFRPRARKAWDKLTPDLKRQLGKRLEERQRSPRVASARLSGMPECYKIKLRAAGVRLVYQVVDEQLVILVLAIGKRDRNEAYLLAKRELDKLVD
jgi:mRNA interferase RelE/StbE